MSDTNNEDKDNNPKKGKDGLIRIVLAAKQEVYNKVKDKKGKLTWKEFALYIGDMCPKVTEESVKQFKGKA